MTKHTLFIPIVHVVIYLYLFCSVTASNEIFGQLQIYQSDNFETQHSELIHVIKGSKNYVGVDYQLLNVDSKVSHELRSGLLLTVKGNYIDDDVVLNITKMDTNLRLFNVTSIKLVRKLFIIRFQNERLTLLMHYRSIILMIQNLNEQHRILLPTRLLFDAQWL